MKKEAMGQEVAGLLAEKHTQGYLRGLVETALAQLGRTRDREVSVNDLVSAVVCAMLQEKEIFRAEYAIKF